MSVLNTLQYLQYKQCLCILTLLNVRRNLQTRSAQFIDQKKSQIVQKAQIELSINSNTTRPQI